MAAAFDTLRLPIGPGRGDAHEALAARARQLAQALALGAEHERDGPRQRLVFDQVLGRAVEAERDAALLLQLGEGARKVLHQRDGNELERAGGGLRQRAVERRAVAARHDQAGGAEHGGRAQDGADVVRVGDLVEHDERARLRRARRGPAMSGSSSGSVSSMTPWCTVSSPSRRSRSRGVTRSGANCRAVTASARRFSAFSVISSRSDLAGVGCAGRLRRRARRRAARGPRRRRGAPAAAGANGADRGGRLGRLGGRWPRCRLGDVGFMGSGLGAGGAHPAAFPFDIQGAGADKRLPPCRPYARGDFI